MMFIVQGDIYLRKSQANDGYEIHQLVANSPPLDLNSVYNYYLLSGHFADTCVVAEFQGRIIGFISAYRMPQRIDTLFVWQVVVDEPLRGKNIAWRMLNSLLQRFTQNEVSYVKATVNPSNTASRRLFERLAVEQKSELKETTFLDASAFGSNGSHEREIMFQIALNKQNS